MTRQAGGALSRPWSRPWSRPALPAGLAAASAATVLAALPAASATAVLVAGAGVPGGWSPGLLASTAAMGIVGGLLAGLRPRYVGGWLLLASGTAFLVGQWCHVQVVAAPPGGEQVPLTAWSTTGSTARRSCCWAPSCR